MTAAVHLHLMCGAVQHIGAVLVPPSSGSGCVRLDKPVVPLVQQHDRQGRKHQHCIHHGTPVEHCAGWVDASNTER